MATFFHFQALLGWAAKKRDHKDKRLIWNGKETPWIDRHVLPWGISRKEKPSLENKSAKKCTVIFFLFFIPHLSVVITAPQKSSQPECQWCIGPHSNQTQSHLFHLSFLMFLIFIPLLLQLLVSPSQWWQTGGVPKAVVPTTRWVSTLLTGNSSRNVLVMPPVSILFPLLISQLPQMLPWHTEHCRGKQWKEPSIKKNTYFNQRQYFCLYVWRYLCSARSSHLGSLLPKLHSTPLHPTGPSRLSPWYLQSHSRFC